MKLRIKVDKKLCIGSGNCVLIAKKHFTLNANNRAEIKSIKKGNSQSSSELFVDVSGADKETLLTAAMACPAQAITITDEKENKIYP